MADEELEELMSLVASFHGDAMVPAEPPSQQNDGEQNCLVLQDLAQSSGGTESTDLLAWARLSKERRRHEGQLQALRQAKDRALEALRLVAQQYPMVAKVFGLVRQGMRDRRTQCIVHMKLACAPKIRGSGLRSYTISQNRSCQLLTSCLLQEQRLRMEESFMIDRGCGDANGASAISWDRVAYLAVQWDETSQRLAAGRSHNLPDGVKKSRGQVGVQVMMASGRFGFCGVAQSVLGAMSLVSRNHNWHAPGLRLEAQSSDHIFEGLLRSLPAKVLDKRDIDMMARDSAAVILACSCDRAAANFVVARALMHCFAEEHPSKPFFLHVEPCGLHGVALVKNKSPSSKQIMSALYSFTKWVRVGKNIEGLSSQIATLIKNNLHVRRAPRPQGARSRSLHMLEVLYGKLEDSEYMWHDSKKHQRKVKSSLLEDLESFLEVSELEATGRMVFTH